MAERRFVGGRAGVRTARQRRATRVDRTVDTPLGTVYADASRATGVQPTADEM